MLGRLSASASILDISVVDEADGRGQFFFGLGDNYAGVRKSKDPGAGMAMGPPYIAMRQRAIPRLHGSPSDVRTGRACIGSARAWQWKHSLRVEIAGFGGPGL